LLALQRVDGRQVLLLVTRRRARQELRARIGGDRRVDDGGPAPLRERRVRCEHQHNSSE